MLEGTYSLILKDNIGWVLPIRYGKKATLPALQAFKKNECLQLKALAHVQKFTYCLLTHLFCLVAHSTTREVDLEAKAKL